MADQRLTDKTAKTTTPARTDLVHNVDVSNTTDNAAGSTFKMDVNTLLGAGLSEIQGCLILKRTGSDQSMTVLQSGDVILYIDVTEDAMIIGVIQAAITTVPADLRVKAKCERFYDGSALL